jgi:fucose 4-O-acetylase-like acetyltransferase
MSAQLSLYTSRKFRFFSFLSMALLVFVHGYNMNQRYLQPFTLVEEPMTFTSFFAYFTANGLFRFRIPLLFAISGYLFALHDEKPFGKRIGNRFRTLMVPYFLWSAIGLGVAVLLAQWSFTRDAVYNAHLQPPEVTGSGPHQTLYWKTFDQYTVGDWLEAFLWPTSFQLWFIRCLFFYNLLYPLLKKGVLKIPAVLFTVFGLLWFFGLGFIILEGEGLLFFSLGIWLCKRGKNIEQKPGWLSLRTITAITLAACAGKTILAFYGVRIMAPFGLAFLTNALHKIVVVGGLLVAWYGLDRIATAAMRNRWLVKLSGYAFIIYALHVPLITYLIDPVHGLLNSFSLYRLFTYIFLPVAVIIFCIGCGWLLRTTLPGLYRLLTGNRGLERPATMMVTAKKAEPVSV